MNYVLNDFESSALQNGLRIAAEAFAQHVKEFEASIPKLEEAEAAGNDRLWITSTGAKVLAEQFRQQREQTLKLLNLFQGAEEIELKKVEMED